MRFIVDAQLPRRLARELCSLGVDAIHTLDLPGENRTADQAILQIAKAEQRIVITKDSDFVDSLLVHNEPEKLLFITTGNTSNEILLNLIRTHWLQITSMLQQGQYVELSTSAITLHF